jgi:hypothetical protein
MRLTFSIIAPKCYELKFSDGSNIIKFKGVKTNSLTSSDIDKLYHGGEVSVINNKFVADNFVGVRLNKTTIKVS